MIINVGSVRKDVKSISFTPISTRKNSWRFGIRYGSHISIIDSLDSKKQLSNIYTVVF